MRAYPGRQAERAAFSEDANTTMRTILGTATRHPGSTSASAISTGICSSASICLPGGPLACSSLEGPCAERSSPRTGHHSGWLSGGPWYRICRVGFHWAWLASTGTSWCTANGHSGRNHERETEFEPRLLMGEAHASPKRERPASHGCRPSASGGGAGVVAPQRIERSSRPAV